MGARTDYRPYKVTYRDTRSRNGSHGTRHFETLEGAKAAYLGYVSRQLLCPDEAPTRVILFKRSKLLEDGERYDALFASYIPMEF